MGVEVLDPVADPRALARTRLWVQGLEGPGLPDAAEVVRRFGAVQAQDYPGGLWAVGLRMAGGTESAVEAALRDRRIVRSWPLRGTLHLTAAEDLGWMLQHLAPRILKSHAARLQRDFDLDEPTLADTRRVISGALNGGRPMTRPELYRVLEAAGIGATRQRGLHVLWHAAQRGLICFGPREGKQQTFVLAEAWLPPTPKLSRAEALARLAERYFLSHGPATVHDFAWWSGLTLTDAKGALQAVRGALDEVRSGGATHWTGASPEPLPAQPGGVRLLPPFDEFTVAYRNRDAVVQRWDPGRSQPGPSLLSPAVVADGQVVGTWGRTLTNRTVVVSLKVQVPLDDVERQALDIETRRYATFLGRELRRASHLGVA